MLSKTSSAGAPATSLIKKKAKEKKISDNKRSLINQRKIA